MSESSRKVNADGNVVHLSHHRDQRRPEEKRFRWSEAVLRMPTGSREVRGGERVRRGRLSLAAKVVATALRPYFNVERGYVAWVSHARLAEATGLSERTVRTAIAELALEGFLDIGRSGGGLVRTEHGLTGRTCEFRMVEPGTGFPGMPGKNEGGNPATSNRPTRKALSEESEDPEGIPKERTQADRLKALRAMSRKEAVEPTPTASPPPDRKPSGPLVRRCPSNPEIMIGAEAARLVGLTLDGIREIGPSWSGRYLDREIAHRLRHRADLHRILAAGELTAGELMAAVESTGILTEIAP